MQGRVSGASAASACMCMAMLAKRDNDVIDEFWPEHDRHEHEGERPEKNEQTRANRKPGPGAIPGLAQQNGSN